LIFVFSDFTHFYCDHAVIRFKRLPSDLEKRLPAAVECLRFHPEVVFAIFSEGWREAIDAP